MEENRMNKKPKFNLAHAIKSDAMPFNLGLTVAAIIVNIALLYIMVSINSYSAFSKGIFIGINVFILLLLIGLNALVFFFIKTKKVQLFQIGVVFLTLLIIISVPGTYLTFKVQGTINKVVNTSGTQTQSVTTSIVVFGNDIKDIDSLNGKMLGVVPDTTYATKATEQLDEKQITVTDVEFDSFTTLLLALVGGEIDAAALPGNYASMYANEEGLKDEMDNFHSLLDFETVVKHEVKDSSGKDLTSEPFSVLVLGNADGNTDAIIVASFNPISMTLTMTSIARDSWVPICGKGSNKINAAYSYGGISCVMSTVEDLLDIELDFYFMANFKGVVEIVDAIGGIVVNNPYEFVGQDSSAERGHETVWIPAGENVPLNGEQALAFARERHLYAMGDFQRQINQQQVIQSILTKCLRIRDLNTMMKVLDAAGNNIETNISTDQLIDLFNYVMKKIDRWKFKDEHPEKVINIIGSRVTGYNSSVWSDAAGLALSIVVPYEGSIADNREAFLRNMWQDTTTKKLRNMTMDASYNFVAPVVSNETYSEAIKQSDTPPSYWCKITDGTWSNGSCACPAGTQFISEKGCQAVQTNFDQLLDDQSCVANNGKWTWDTGKCTSACPSGYVENTYGYCEANTCSASNPKGCTSQDACQAVGLEWKDDYCAAPQKCDANNLHRCTTESDCSSAGGSWNSDKNKCDIKKSDDQVKCEADGNCSWSNGKPVCKEGMEWKDGKCQTKAPTAVKHKVTINYVYEDGSKAAESKVLEVEEGKDYSQASPTITGYTPDKATVSGKMDKSDVTVTVTYKKDGGSSSPNPEIKYCDICGKDTDHVTKDHKCPEGQHVEGNKCVANKPQGPVCGICGQNHETSAHQCDPGYHVEGNQCVADKPQGPVCGICGQNHETNAHQCDPGYHVEGNQCVADKPQSPVCGICGQNHETNAHQCDPGYHVEGNKCVADKPQGPVCGICSQNHETNAHQCDPGYHVEGNQCVADKPQGPVCGICGQNHETNAHDCGEGQHLVDGSCVPIESDPVETSSQNENQPTLLSEVTDLSPYMNIGFKSKRNADLRSVAWFNFR